MEAHFRKESRRIFNAIDKDSSGRIDHEELAEGLNDSSSFLRLCGLAKVDFEELKSLADSWDLESFTRYALWHMRRVTCCRREKEEKDAALVEQAWMVFLSIDTNGDSQLDQAELAAGVKTNRALNRLFKGELVVGDFIPESVDRNKDGLVSFDEFKEAVLAEASGASQEALDDAAFACEEGDLGCLFG
jgi:Ca2+-binding EF-hand superfamily protein